MTNDNGGFWYWYRAGLGMALGMLSAAGVVGLCVWYAPKLVALMTRRP